MMTPTAVKMVILVAFAVTGLSPVVQAQSRKKKERRAQAVEQYVFVTGSFIPQRVEKKAIGTKTVSPLRIIDRREIDQRGRFTTADILRDEPSLYISGY